MPAENLPLFNMEHLEADLWEPLTETIDITPDIIIPTSNLAQNNNNRNDKIK